MASASQTARAGSTTISVRVDSARVLALLKKAEKRMAYAIVNSINATAKDVQAAEKAEVARRFTLRKRDFILREIAIIQPFASVPQKRYEAMIRVGSKRRLLLANFEKGFTREPFTNFADGKVAVPIIGGARPTKARSVPEDLWIQRLNLRKKSGAHKVSGGGQTVGNLGAYVVPGIGIYRRIASGASKILYVFKSPFRIPPRLNWMAVARRAVASNFSKHLAREVSDTLAKHSAESIKSLGSGGPLSSGGVGDE